MQQKFKKGDLVSITGVVKYDQDNNRVSVQVDYQDVTVPVEEAVLVRPFFKAGDRARLPNAPFGELTGFTDVEVLATHEEFVWIKEADGSTNVALAADLLREADEGGEG